VPQDLAEALRWYRKAAEQGNPKGQNALGLLYERGDGVSQDLTLALFWFRKAVDQGYAKAQYNLGNMYFHGCPVKVIRFCRNRRKTSTL
jgi:TPR repeat protein